MTPLLASTWRRPPGSSLNAASSGMLVTSQSALAAVEWERSAAATSEAAPTAFSKFDPSRLIEDNCRARSLSAICQMVIVEVPRTLLHFWFVVQRARCYVVPTALLGSPRQTRAPQPFAAGFRNSQHS